MARTKQPKHTMILLEKGTGEEPVFMDVEPTMMTITHKGEKYSKTISWAEHPSGATAAMYLWTGYGDWKLSQIRQREASELALAIQRAEAEGMTTTNTKGQG